MSVKTIQTVSPGRASSRKVGELMGWASACAMAAGTSLIGGTGLETTSVPVIPAGKSKLNSPLSNGTRYIPYPDYKTVSRKPAAALFTNRTRRQTPRPSF